jgi:hypothetical protein
MGSYAAENLTYRLAFVGHNRSDVDQLLHLRIAGGRGGNDRAAIQVASEHDWSVLAVQHTTQHLLIVATISSGGLATAQGTGTTYIVATSGSITSNTATLIVN